MMTGLLTASCTRNKSWTCKCSVAEIGTVTTIMEVEPVFPLFPGSSNTETQSYINRSYAYYTHDGLSKRAMRAACPAESEEVIYERAVASSGGSLTINIITENKGTRTKSCSIEE